MEKNQYPADSSFGNNHSQTGSRKLTIKEQRFVEEFCVNFNLTQAAKAAGYSVKSARFIGHENLTKPHIKAAISDRLKELSMSAEEATKRLSDWGRGSFAAFTKSDPEQGLVLDLNSEQAQANLHLIKKVKQTKRVLLNEGIPYGAEYTTEIELHDAKDAVVQIAKIHGQYVTNVNHAGTIATKLEGMSDEQLDDVIELVLNKLTK